MKSKDLAYVKSLTIGEDEKIPTPQEVFELVGTSMHYELELKGFTVAFQKVIALVKQYQLVEYIEFTSPHAYTLPKLKELEPKFKAGVFLAPFPGWMDPELGRTFVVNNVLLSKTDVLHRPLGIFNKDLISLVIVTT